MNKTDNDIYSLVMKTPITGFDGMLGVCIENDCVSSIDFVESDIKPATTVFARKVESQLNAYFENPAYKFSVPVSLKGTAFRERVWTILRTIPSGETRCYGEVAKELDSSARAIGGACRHNPVPFIIPCHRVIAQTGLGGYSGETDGWKMKIKCWLLAHESEDRHCS